MEKTAFCEVTIMSQLALPHDRLLRRARGTSARREAMDARNQVGRDRDQRFRAFTTDIRPNPMECDDWRRTPANPALARNSVQLPSM